MGVPNNLIKLLKESLPVKTGLFSENKTFPCVVSEDSLKIYIPDFDVSNNVISIARITTENNIDNVDTLLNSVTLGYSHDFTDGYNVGPVVFVLSNGDSVTYDVLSAPDSRTLLLKGDITPLIGGRLRQVFELGPFGAQEVESYDPTDGGLIISLNNKGIIPYGNAEAVVPFGYRISLAYNFERAMEMYTASPQEDFWMYIVMEQSQASRDQASKSDAISTQKSTNNMRFKLLNNFSIYVFCNVTGEITGEKAIDLCYSDILQAVLSVVYGAQLTKRDSYTCMLTSHGTYYYNSSVYAHEYSFQYVEEFTLGDSYVKNFIQSTRLNSIFVGLKVQPQHDLRRKK